MNVEEIFNRVKRQFGDEVGAQIRVDDAYRWIQDAQRELAVSNDLLQTTATTSIVTGESQYALPTNLLTLRAVRVGGKKVRSLSLDQAAEWTTDKQNGVPTHFSQYALKIDLYPTPNYSKSDDLQLYYTRIPVAPNDLLSVPEIPVQYHNRIVEYCIAQAHELDDNMESYKMKMEMFRDGALTLNNIGTMQEDSYPSISVVSADTDLGHVWLYE